MSARLHWAAIGFFALGIVCGGFAVVVPGWLGPYLKAGAGVATSLGFLLIHPERFTGAANVTVASGASEQAAKI